MAITNNVLIEKLLGPEVADGHQGCICVEDVIDVSMHCDEEENDGMFKKILENVWPFQLGSMKQTMAENSLKHEAHGRTVRKKNTSAEKGGYEGFLGDKINAYVHSLI